MNSQDSYLVKPTSRSYLSSKSEKVVRIKLQKPRINCTNRKFSYQLSSDLRSNSAEAIRLSSKYQKLICYELLRLKRERSNPFAIIFRSNRGFFETFLRFSFSPIELWFFTVFSGDFPPHNSQSIGSRTNSSTSCRFLPLFDFSTSHSPSNHSFLLRNIHSPILHA